MRRDSIIYLIPKVNGTPTKNKYGDPITNKGMARKLFATKKSVTRSEFYQAGVDHPKPEFTFEIWKHEYKGETILKFNDIEYKVIRTYEPDYKNIELICAGLTNEKGD